MKTLIFVTCILWYVAAEPNVCCPNNDIIIKNNCSNGEQIWVREFCTSGAYMLSEFEYKQMDNDELLEPGNFVVPRERYCFGLMGSEEEKVAMVCFPDDNMMDFAEGQSGYVARLICSIISVICLALTLIVYIILPNLRDLQGKCIMFTLLSLLFAFLLLAIVQQAILVDDSVCVAIACLLYFWFICVFFWLNVVSFNVWRSVVRPRLLSNKKFLFLYYNIYAWGGSIILLMIVVICHHTSGNHLNPNFGEYRCWFSEPIAVRAFFYAPISILIVINILMYISTAWTLSSQAKYIDALKHRSHQFKFRLYLKQFIIMGVCWVFEPLSDLLLEQGYYLWIVTDYINCLQGLILFLLLVVFRKRVRRDLAKRGYLCFRRLPKEWATMPDEDCEELEEDVDDISSTHALNEQTNQSL